MKKEEFVALGIAEDIAEKAANASAEELKGYVPMSRFNEVNEAKKTAENTIKERDKQLDDLKKSTEDVDGLKKQIESLQEANKTMASENEKALKALKREGIDTALLTEAGAKNAKAVMALLDAVDDKYDDDAYKAERMKQIEAIRKDNDYLFNPKNQPPQVQGARPIPSVDGTPDVKRTGYETRLAEARKNNNTTAAITIKREAAEEGIFLM
ncbi:MAG: phage scaffolding protein [Lachnospiraceae bacterium]